MRVMKASDTEIFSNFFVYENLKVAMNSFSEQLAIIKNKETAHSNPEAADSRAEELRLQG